MRPEVERRLHELNRGFYERRAAAFDQKRSGPWRGWQRVIQLVADRFGDRASQEGLRVLDVGCGNGRFAVALADRLGAARIRWTGIDASLPLLEIAAERTAGLAESTVVHQDLFDTALGESPASAVRASDWDLVVAFGVLHHVPGEARRQALVRSLASRLGRQGLGAISLWQFGDDPRFARREVDWSHLDLAPADVDGGDVLLRWGPLPEPGRRLEVRYCHHASPVSGRRWIERSGARLIDTFRDDGRSRRLNAYLIFRAPSSSPRYAAEPAVERSTVSLATRPDGCARAGSPSSCARSSRC